VLTHAMGMEALFGEAFESFTPDLSYVKKGRTARKITLARRRSTVSHLFPQGFTGRVSLSCALRLVPDVNGSW
jgi:hypothetical protein